MGGDDYRRKEMPTQKSLIKCNQQEFSAKLQSNPPNFYHFCSPFLFLGEQIDYNYDRLNDKINVALLLLKGAGFWQFAALFQ